MDRTHFRNSFETGEAAVSGPGGPPMTTERRGGWPGLNLLLTLWGAPFKLRLGGAFANASCWYDSQFFSAPCCPLGFDLDDSVCAGEVVTEAAPFPIFGPLHQSAYDWVAMNVAQLFHKFAFAPHVEVVVPCLPE